MALEINVKSMGFSGEWMEGVAARHCRYRGNRWKVEIRVHRQPGTVAPDRKNIVEIKILSGECVWQPETVGKDRETRQN